MSYSKEKKYIEQARRMRRRNRFPAINESLDYAWRFFHLKIHCYLKNFLLNYRGHLHDVNIFKPVALRMDISQLNRIFNQSATPALRLKLLKLDKSEEIDLSVEVPTELFGMLWEHPGTNQKFRQVLSQYLDKQICELTASLNNDPDPLSGKFAQLGDLFKLEPIEIELLIFARIVIGELWSVDDFRGELSPGKINRIAAALGVTDEELQRIGKNDGRLRRLECIDEELNFNRDLLQFLGGVDDKPLASRYFAINETTPLPWDFYGELAVKHGEFLKKLIASNKTGQGIKILLYGEPGTGKTSFAQSLAAELGRKAYFIAQSFENSGRSSDSSSGFRFAALQVCAFQAEPEESLIIIDEADKMLSNNESPFICFSNSKDSDKGMLNSVLDSIKQPCIWITNTPADALDLSSRRRFDYSIKFENITAGQRMLIWKNLTQKHGLDTKMPEEVLKTLATKYEISAGGIELALRNCKNLCESIDLEKTIIKLIEPHCELMGIVNETDKFITANDYSLEGLNIKGSLPLASISTAIKRFQTGSGDEIDQPRMNLLLSGPPGTGKTEFVKYLAKTLDCKVLVKVGCELLSKFVGETEKNLNRAFVEAEAEKAILFLDEIDGMLYSRELAQRSWEITQVNELLYQMENFRGVLIGATNFTKILDTATLRRFTFKLEFDYLDDAGKNIFFERIFKMSLSSAEKARLQAIPRLSPGDFRTVRQSLYYLNPKELKIADLIDGLESEVSIKNGGTKIKPIGF